MKHKILFLGSLIVIVAALFLAVHSNNQAVQSAKVHAAAAANHVKQSVSTNQKLQSQVKTQTLEITNLQAQCQKGLKDYQLLTSTQKLQGSLPVCALQNASASVQ